MEQCGELPMALARFSLPEVRTFLALQQLSLLPLRESYPGCVHGIFPSLTCSPGSGGALGNSHRPWLGFAAEGASPTTCGELRVLLGGIRSCVMLAVELFVS